MSKLLKSIKFLKEVTYAVGMQIRMPTAVERIETVNAESPFC